MEVSWGLVRSLDEARKEVRREFMVLDAML
jgi:hypothetical protein